MSYTLTANIRAITGRAVHTIRTEGHIPAIVYGANTSARSIQLNRQAFIKTWRESGESTIVELQIDAFPVLHALIYDVQFDPVTHEAIHVDFRSVDMTKEMEAKVDLVFVGESPAVKSFSGILVQSHDHVTVRCLPLHLPHHLEVDLSKLQTFDDAIHVKDLVIPEHVRVLDDLDVTIAVVTPPRTEAELAALDTAVEVDVSAIEVEKKGKEEEVAEAGQPEEVQK